MHAPCVQTNNWEKGRESGRIRIYLVAAVGVEPASAALLRTTTMSSSLPPEILDLVIDQLRDEPATLKACCLTSKSCIPRTRSHLFAHVEFNARRHTIGLWTKTFPDPSTSPAHHARSLSIHGLVDFTTRDLDASGLIRTFCNVVHLQFDHFTCADNRALLATFHGFSHTVKSLRLASTSLEVFDLVYSFPLLEDLALVSLLYNGGDTVGQRASSTSPTSPKLTGSLELKEIWGIQALTRKLLDLPDGLRFTRITVSCPEGNYEPVMDLVSRCSETLESLVIDRSRTSVSLPAPLIGQYLTTARGHSRQQGGSPKPLQGDETQRPNVSVLTPLDCSGTPNRGIQKPSSHHHQPAQYFPG